MANTKGGPKQKGRLKRKGSVPPGSWQYTAGSRPFTLVAYERKDKGNDIYIRYGSVGKSSKRKRLADPIRDEKGRIDHALESAVIAQAVQAQKDLEAGNKPLQPVQPVVPKIATLRSVFDQVLAVGTGLYSDPSSQWRDMRTIANDICEVLGASTPISSVTPHTAHILYRSMIKLHKSKKKRSVINRNARPDPDTGLLPERIIPWGGKRMIERAVTFLFRSVRFYADTEAKIAPLLPKGWQQELNTEWQKKVSKRFAPKKPRHSAADVKTMFQNIHLADPRLQLLIELGAEARLGQVSRCTRADLTLTKGALGFGCLEVTGIGRKRGTFVDLTQQQNANIRKILNTGYLQELEENYPRNISDYPLFPGGRFREGKSRVKSSRLSPTGVVAPKSVSRDGLRGWFMEFEDKLDIAHVTGRGWYGVRRQTADLAENSMKDERALNLLTGHSDSKMRRGYQEHTDEVRQLAVTARETIRNRVQPVPQPVPKKRRPVQVQK